jgi:hypothetical protein
VTLCDGEDEKWEYVLEWLTTTTCENATRQPDIAGAKCTRIPISAPGCSVMRAHLSFATAALHKEAMCIGRTVRDILPAAFWKHPRRADNI